MMVARQEPGTATDIVLNESPRGLRVRDENDLVLYIVSLYGVANEFEELVSGDALLVRPRGTSVYELLSAVLDCAPERLPELLARSGSWSVREVDEIDGHRVRFEA